MEKKILKLAFAAYDIIWHIIWHLKFMKLQTYFAFISYLSYPSAKIMPGKEPPGIA